MAQIFQYSERELEHLRSRDSKLARVIDEVGMIEREVNPDLFSSLVHAIVGQQISTKAAATVWGRVLSLLGEITPHNICDMEVEQLQGCGLSFRKVEYIKSLSQRVLSGELDIESLSEMSDEEVCTELSKLNGIGVWTAEMLMTFSMERPNIISYGDLAIVRGLRMVYGHRKITKELFRKYQRRYSPYASVASLYLWAVSAGAVEGLRDPAPKVKPKERSRA